MLTGKQIICLAGCEWDFTWQPTQEIMSRLAKAGNRVLYIQPTGTRGLRWSDRRRITQRVSHKLFGVRAASSIPPELSLYAPLTIPLPYSSLARRVNRWLINWRIRRWLRAPLSPDVLIWFYFPSPLNADLMQDWKEGLRIYHLMSSAEAVRPDPTFLAANESMLRDCDLVFANSNRLRTYASQFNAHVHLFRAGVSLELFEAISPGPPVPPPS